MAAAILAMGINAGGLTDKRPPIAESELGDAQYYRLPARHIELGVRMAL